MHLLMRFGLYADLGEPNCWAQPLMVNVIVVKTSESANFFMVNSKNVVRWDKAHSIVSVLIWGILSYTIELPKGTFGKNIWVALCGALAIIGGDLVAKKTNGFIRSL